MVEKDEEQLTALVTAAALKVQVGGHYVHYKQKMYRVVSIALRESDLEPCVVYEAEYGSHLRYIRTIDDWLALVEVDGRKVPRFKLVAGT